MTNKEFEQGKKDIAKTQFTIKTKGENHMEISVSGCRAGLVYKLAVALSQICKEGAIKIDDLEDIAEIAKDMIKTLQINTVDEEKPDEITVSTLKGKAADELYKALKKIDEGKMKLEDLDIEKFFKNDKKRGKWF